MQYRIIHTTNYNYFQKVSLCHNVARLLLRDTDHQLVKSCTIDIQPLPEILNQYNDFLGNKVLYFAIQREHQELKVKIISEVVTMDKEFVQPIDISWEAMLDPSAAVSKLPLEIKQYILQTPLTMAYDVICDYAKKSFKSGKGFYECSKDLMQRIYDDFEFSSGFTTVSTPLQEVMKTRKGVCQDFAHLAIACIRSIGLPVRYVSGYIETLPPPGEEKLFGVDASHAWYSIYLPNQGWYDFDPTNNIIPANQHLCLGWGRDYADISPLKGVIFSSGTHQLQVSVDVRRISSSHSAF